MSTVTTICFIEAGSARGAFHALPQPVLTALGAGSVLTALHSPRRKPAEADSSGFSTCGGRHWGAGLLIPSAVLGPQGLITQPVRHRAQWPVVSESGIMFCRQDPRLQVRDLCSSRSPSPRGQRMKSGMTPHSLTLPPEPSGPGPPLLSHSPHDPSPPRTLDPLLLASAHAAPPTGAASPRLTSTRAPQQLGVDQAQPPTSFPHGLPAPISPEHQVELSKLNLDPWVKF